MEQPNIAALIASATALEDQTETVASFEQELIEAGVTVGRLIEYIELGKHKQKDYQGKPKPDADMVRVTFELLHPTKNIKEYEVDGEKVRHGQLISLRLPKKLGEKAKYKKLFNKCTYGRADKTHLAQCLGEAFVITVYHNVEKVDGKDVTYVNLDKDGEYGIGAPFAVDALTGEKKAYDVPAATRPLRVFFWSMPSKETWDSLFIDGTREKKDDKGNVTQVSKNWLQETILSATNYKGSMLEAMLSDVADLPVTEQAQKPAEQPKADDLPFTPGNETVATTTAQVEQQVTQKQAAPTTTADDALAALGLK